MKRFKCPICLEYVEEFKDIIKVTFVENESQKPRPDAIERYWFILHCNEEHTNHELVNYVMEHIRYEEVKPKKKSKK